MTRVVVSVGTDHHPFGRLLEWVAVARSELDLDVVVQRGSTPAHPGLETVDFVSPDELGAMMREADVVVTHGGPGTIALALRSGRRPIVVPRDPTRGEHVDDHQVRYATELAQQDIVDVALSLPSLVAYLAAPRPAADERWFGNEQEAAVTAFARLIDQLIGGVLPRRPWRSRVVIRRSP